MIEVGIGLAGITPRVGIPLSGFIARENLPSTHIDSQLRVRALAIRKGEERHFLLNYELLGLGESTAGFIQNSLERELGPNQYLLTATHTHSGPVVGLLVGETPTPQEYLDLLAQRSIQAIRTALENLQPARLLLAEIPMPGLTYNRRALLVDGRVSILPEPDLPVVQRGPIDERMTVLAWQNLQGEVLAGIVHYACHGVAVLSQGIGSDIPGALAETVSRHLGAPCLFLQGTAGDVNPTTVTASPADMMRWMDRALPHLAGLKDALRLVEVRDFQVAEEWRNLTYADLPVLADAEKQLRDLKRIANGDFYSSDLQETLAAFKNTMNIPPGAALDPAQTRFVALALGEAAHRTLAAVQDKGAVRSQKLHLGSWNFGEIALVFMACEAFTTSGIKLQELCPEMKILTVTYLAPLVGYIPDRDSLRLGGYEVSDAWRFYGHPAPFAEGSEQQMLEAAVYLLKG